MFVLMDIEWIENRCHHINPTQIAAMRVDGQWNCCERFFSRIYPRDNSFHNWKHMAYTGGAPSDFLYARGITRVLTDLQGWLREDDVICFWYMDSKNVLKSIYNLVLRSKVPQRIVVLDDYVAPFLAARGMKIGNAYALCNEYGAQAAGPKHYSQNDVVAMQKALGCIQYPAELLLGEPPQDRESAGTAERASEEPRIPDATWPYRLETETGIFHRADCEAIPRGAVLTGHPDLKYYFRKKLQACPHCMKEDARRGIRERNRDIIDRTHYRFIFAERSDVFHRRGCQAILSTTDVIKGAGYYDTVAKTGRRPCKLCHPVPDAWLNKAERKKAGRAAKASAAAAAVPGRAMNSREQRAYKRYVEARGERFTTSPDSFGSDTARDDFYTLTQPRFAFFSAAGYRNFHKRNCQKLHGLSNIVGFARYKDAVRAGHTPCKFCKPTPKLDIECSIPITNKKRKGESVSDLKVLCEEQSYRCEVEDEYFCISTAVGRWKIDFSSQPYVVYHINLIRTPENECHYHRQPRLFLSLLDTFEYIERHDRKLAEKTPGLTEHGSQKATG